MLTPRDVEEINEGITARSFIQGGTITVKKFARIQTYLVLLLALPKWLNRALIRAKIYRVFPDLGMLAHSIARVLDRHKEYDVDAANFMARYRLFTRKKLAKQNKDAFSAAWIK